MPEETLHGIEIMYISKNTNPCFFFEGQTTLPQVYVLPISPLGMTPSFLVLQAASRLPMNEYKFHKVAIKL
jgi:hypothetical protein